MGDMGIQKEAVRLQYVFTTSRLRVRLAVPDSRDLDFLCNLWNDPRVMRFVGFPQGLDITSGQLEEQLTVDREDPFDRVLMVEMKGTGEVIGQCKLGSSNQEGVAHTDVKLKPEFQGRGYGTEIKQALLDYQFTHTDCVAVEGSPNKMNAASIRMQEKVGGVVVKEGVFKAPEECAVPRCDVPYFLYHVTREAWLSVICNK